MLVEKGGLISRLGRYLIHSTALAGSLLYSSPVYSQDQPSEPQPAAEEPQDLEAIKKRLIEEIKERERLEAERLAKEREAQENPEQPAEQVPEETPTVPVEQPKELKVKYEKQKLSHFIWHSLGGPTPNGDLQGTRAYSGFNMSFKEFINSEFLFTNRSLSYLDQNGNRIIENSPFNGHGKIKFNSDNLKLEFGYTGNLEERISRETTEINQIIGSSAIQVITRNKTREVNEYHAGMFRGDIDGLRASLIYFVNLFPTIRTHEIFQSVTDSSNPSASFTSSDELRSPTPRNKREGLMFSIGSNNNYKTTIKENEIEKEVDIGSLSADLIGLFERETIDLSGVEKREIQRILGGLDIRADLKSFVPRFLIAQSFYNDKIGEQRYAHKANATKLIGSAYLDLGQLKFAEQKIQSDDPNIETITKSKNIPVLLGGSLSLDINYEDETNKYARPSIRAVLGIGTAFSGRNALERILNLEYTSSLSELGLTKEYGPKAAGQMIDYLSATLGADLADPTDWSKLGLLGILQASREDQGSSKKPGYEGRIYGVLGPLTASAFYANNGFESEKFGGSLGFYPKKYLLIGVGYTEYKQPNKKREQLFSVDLRLQLR